jgi:hypothetical protein
MRFIVIPNRIHKSREGNHNGDIKFGPMISVIRTLLCKKSLPLADLMGINLICSYHAISNTIPEVA